MVCPLKAKQTANCKRVNLHSRLAAEIGCFCFPPPLALEHCLFCSARPPTSLSLLPQLPWRCPFTKTTPSCHYPVHSESPEPHSLFPLDTIPFAQNPPAPHSHFPPIHALYFKNLPSRHYPIRSESVRTALHFLRSTHFISKTFCLDTIPFAQNPPAPHSHFPPIHTLYFKNLPSRHYPIRSESPLIALSFPSDPRTLFQKPSLSTLSHSLRISPHRTSFPPIHTLYFKNLTSRQYPIRSESPLIALSFLSDPRTLFQKPSLSTPSHSLRISPHRTSFPPIHTLYFKNLTSRHYPIRSEFSA